MKVFLVPMRWGPSFSAKRNTSDSFAFASATVHMRFGLILGCSIMISSIMLCLYISAI